MLERYLPELCQYREMHGGAIETASYLHLGAYWSESGRHAFLFRSARQVVGFALMRTMRLPSSTSDPSIEVATLADG